MTTIDTLPEEDEDELLVLALSTGQTYETAADTAGVSRSTVARRMAQTTFRHRVARARQDYIALAAGLVVEELRKSVETVAEIRDDPEAKHSDRLRAALGIISAVQALADTSTEDRIRALEEKFLDE